MKKIICFMLATVMALMLVGCSFTAILPDGDANKNDSEVDIPVGDKNAADESKKTVSRGTFEGDVYKNDYLGFEFTKPESWMYYTDEEIAAVFNMSAEQMGEQFEKALENNVSLYDMMVVDMTTGTNINVGYENLVKTLATNITEAQYIEAMKKQLATVAGMTVEFPEESETAKLGDNEYTKCVCTTTVSGATMTQVYYLRKVDTYMASIIVTIVGGYTVEDIEAMFR